MAARVTLGLLVACLVACGPEGERRTGKLEPAPLEIAGDYQVEGSTVDKESGDERPLSGRVKIVVDGKRYTTHFEFSTRFPGTEAAAAKGVGTGEGQIDGRVLLGTAQVQLSMANVPGVDVGFAFVPPEVSPRIRSSSRAEFRDDGSVKIVLESAAAAGSEYRPTRTTLVGRPLR